MPRNFIGGFHIGVLGSLLYIATLGSTRRVDINRSEGLGVVDDQGSTGRQPDRVAEGGLDLEPYEGQVVYLDFWASWCPPCLKSFPFMDELQAEYGDDGFVVIAVNLDEDSKDAREFMENTTVNFFVGRDEQGALATSYNVKTMPSTYLIGRDGVIKEVHRGFRSSDKDKIKQLVSSLL